MDDRKFWRWGAVIEYEKLYIEWRPHQKRMEGSIIVFIANGLALFHRFLGNICEQPNIFQSGYNFEIGRASNPENCQKKAHEGGSSEYPPRLRQGDAILFPRIKSKGLREDMFVQYYPLLNTCITAQFVRRYIEWLISNKTSCFSLITSLRISTPHGEYYFSCKEWNIFGTMMCLFQIQISSHRFPTWIMWCNPIHLKSYHR